MPLALKVVLGIAGTIAVIVLKSLQNRRRPWSWRRLLQPAAIFAVVFVVGLFAPQLFPHHVSSPSIWKAGVRTCMKEFDVGETFSKVNCRDLHGSEVVAVVLDPAPPAAPYPAGSQLRDDAIHLCTAPFTKYVGIAPDISPNAILRVVAPSEPEWAGGRRTIVCLASGKNDDQLLGSVQNTAETEPYSN